MCSDFHIKAYIVGIHLNYLNKFIKAYAGGTHLNCLNNVEAIQMSTHNICYHKEDNITRIAF